MFKKILVSLLLLTAVLNATIPTEESVTRLYIATFDRAPDADGLDYWMKSGLTLEEIAASFFEQEETKEKYPDEFSDEDFIIEVYANLFDRAPDSAGFDYWLEELRSGRISRATFILAVTNGALGDDKKILDNKTIVGLAYAKDGRNDVEEAYKVMEGVTADHESVNKTLCEFSLPGCIMPPKPTPPGPGPTPPGPGPTPPVNHPPVADAGTDRAGILIGSFVELNGSASTDPDGDPLTYAWTMTTKPTGSSAVLSDPTIVDPKFTADKAGTYIVSLIVNDGKVDSVADTVNIMAVAPALKKTGQTIIYSRYDDGHYQMGVDTSYTRASDVVKDNVTGLEWQDDAKVAAETMHWADAEAYCASLPLDGGGWRLPTIVELQGIVVEGANPSIDTVFNVDYVNPGYYFFSSTTYVNDIAHVWIVRFSTGYTNYGYKKSHINVRCVRYGDHRQGV